MQKIIVLFIFLFGLTINQAFTQNLTQTIRGSVVDEDSRNPLIGVTLEIIQEETKQGSTTDMEGRFRLENVPIGRVDLVVNYLGYEQKFIPNLEINSAKEMILEITLTEKVFETEEVVVTANKNKGNPINEMALISARSVSAEQTSRYAGGFNDPSRINSNFAGVTNTQDGGNDIIVRGNSPKYVQWRLEGVQITNPNHFADQNAVSGVLSALNNNLLSTSDFYTGAFPAEFGNALSGVYDVRMRKGNNEKFEGTFSLGLLGTDITLEGPISKKSGSSYLVNYRYSTIGLVTDLGIVDIDGLFNFQDAAFKLWLPTRKQGTFSFFGLLGNSKFQLNDVDPSLWITPGDNFMRPEISENYDKGAYLMNIGLNHFYTFSPNTYLKTTLLYSNEGIDDDIFETVTFPDSTFTKRLSFTNDLKRSAYRANFLLHHKMNARHKLVGGVKYSLFDFDMDQSQLKVATDQREITADFKEQIGTLGTFLSWKYKITKPLTFVAGLHNMNVLYNGKHTLEPRVGLDYRLSQTSNLSIGFGSHSSMESIHNYFVQIEQANGDISRPNSDLGLLKATHFTLGIQKYFGENLRVKLEGYYQHLHNLPVENIDTSAYATLNEGLEFRYVDLVNSGTGKNYGLELTIERFLKNGFYYLINGTLYQSKYTALDQVERNTQYNGRYLANFLVGKEFTKLGKKKNKTLAFNAKLFFGGGKNIIPLLRNTNGAVDVDLENGNFYDYDKAYTSRLDNVYDIIFNVSYKWSKPKTAHELFLSLDNLTNQKARLSEYYDINEPDGIGYQRQVGFYPNLLYRLYF